MWLPSGVASVTAGPSLLSKSPFPPHCPPATPLLSFLQWAGPYSLFQRGIRLFCSCGSRDIQRCLFRTLWGTLRELRLEFLKENLQQTWSNITPGTHSVRTYLSTSVSSRLSESSPVIVSCILFTSLFGKWTNNYWAPSKSKALWKYQRSGDGWSSRDYQQLEEVQLAFSNLWIFI